ncbi:hypothetical protein BGZ65_004012 [Modicella reniformis]|uniref:Uncharacterized protein n=1 Tax=Modicella reniformis TaxID=1440133 RepID=A0A9P6MBF9_9FUNG|nr:hypothetical protein BGZ65_004012 [Modicella reniformis]
MAKGKKNMSTTTTTTVPPAAPVVTVQTAKPKSNKQPRRSHGLTGLPVVQPPRRPGSKTTSTSVVSSASSHQPFDTDDTATPNAVSTWNVSPKKQRHQRGLSAPDNNMSCQSRIQLQLNLLSSASSSQTPTRIRKHSLDSNIDKLSSSRPTNRCTTTNYPQMQGRQDREKKSTTKSSKRKLSAKALAAIRSKALVYKEMPLSGNPTSALSLLEIAIRAFPEFAQQLEESPNNSFNCDSEGTNTSAAVVGNERSGVSAHEDTTGSITTKDNEPMPTTPAAPPVIQCPPTQIDENVEGSSQAAEGSISSTKSKKRAIKDRSDSVSQDKDPSATPKMVSKRRRRDGSSSSTALVIGSQQSSISSIGFEANLMDIEQYVEDDLEGFKRLSY